MPSQNRNEHFQLKKAEGRSTGRSCQRGWAVERRLTGSTGTPDGGLVRKPGVTIMTEKTVAEDSTLSNHPWMEEGEGLRQLQVRSTETELKQSKYSWCNFQVQLCNWSTSHLRHVVRSQPKPTHVVQGVTRSSSTITSFCWSYLLLKHTTFSLGSQVPAF